MPELEDPTSSDGEDSPGVVCFNSRHCKNEAEVMWKLDDNNGPNAEGLTINLSSQLWGHEVKVYVAKSGGKTNTAWDLYDSGASHHMSPCKEDFINYHEIPERPLTAANKQTFSAVGMGNMIISIPNGETQLRIRLTCMLYTPALGFTLVSIG